MVVTASILKPNGTDIEEGTDAKFVLRFSAQVASITYNYWFSAVTASDEDYRGTSGSGSISFASNVNMKEDVPIRLTTLRDMNAREGAETLELHVNVQGATFSDGSTSQVLEITLLDDPRMFGTSDDDNILGYAGRDTIYGGQGADTVLGRDGNDRLLGDAGNDALYGQGGRDLLNGGAGRDTLDGGRDADLLNGGAGADLIFGKTGDDTLSGGKGSDTLHGGAGSDTFVFNTRANAKDIDLIDDFRSGTDHLLLSTSAFPQLSGHVPDDVFVRGPKAKASDDYIIYHKATGKLYFDPDGDGAAQQRLVAELGAGRKLTSGDFIFEG
ncbi:hypothetical protein GCM10007291_49570 [Gemmobacter nanjingensis]|jgi:Ca2+-binding RTX toxin-like protein|uniref:Hemolysin-type calcium-binding repeat-containing protein n=1 Tax=Gemmobacter nanjingensis TaxID=488454 RepID=A0ABQ3FTW2_9RHOB|nr:calcium-binding protein [Gemmobacter nanjingensis]GHC41751.1 hypothetical protein GCM10007291_49570 [Gemmobacter nanjingensis]